jgi:hypothetical protein
MNSNHVEVDEQRANDAMRGLVHLRDTIEDVYLSEVLDGLVTALRTGKDHPLLLRWATERFG